MPLNEKKTSLSQGKHILVLPLSIPLPIESIFPREIAGSHIESLDTKHGEFLHKEKITFENNRFSVSDYYRKLRPLQVIRLTLKRVIHLDWEVNINFISNTSLVIKPALDLESNYCPEKALYLNKLCTLIYNNEDTIKEVLNKSYDFESFYYSSWSTASKQVRPLTQYHLLNVAYTYFRAKRAVVDLQFAKLIRKDKDTGKHIFVFAFRGSKEPEDWLTNLQARQTPFVSNKDLHVHGGFQAALKIFLRGIKKSPLQFNNESLGFNAKHIPLLNQHCKIILTGHSLGGAVATLLGCYLYDHGLKSENLEVYTFGAPPVGSRQFTQSYQGKLPVYRVVNSLDPIPMLSSITHLNHLGQLVTLASNEGELHDSGDYHDNLLDALAVES